MIEDLFELKGLLFARVNCFVEVRMRITKRKVGLKCGSDDRPINNLLFKPHFISKRLL